MGGICGLIYSDTAIVYVKGDDCEMVKDLES